MVRWTFHNITVFAEKAVQTRDMCFSTWSARCTFGEALDSQTLTTLLASPGCATLGVNALLDTVPVWFRYAKFVEQVTCRHTQKKNFITYLTISMISKSSLQMFLSYYINRMEQQTYNQSTVKCNIHHKIIVFFFLRQYFIAHKLLSKPAPQLCPSVK